ncbi:MarR family transcriptional regulator [Alicyclobacillaceae bacterium I2511]|nr:MarR family transcriptional regulator [Alicyclobacillaceae bacterium I2511]
MCQEIDVLTERFDAALHVMIQNLGPQLITHSHLGLTPGQVFMLYFIRQEHPCTISKLAERLEVNPSAITVMLDRLESFGYAVRIRDKNDRRVVIAQLTESGGEALNRVLYVRKHILQYCLAQISPIELDSFVQTLEKLSNISKAMDPKTIIESDKCEHEPSGDNTN